MSDLKKYLDKNERRAGPVGEFIRSCLLVFDIAVITSREELLRSDQLGYLLDCFPSDDVKLSVDGMEDPADHRRPLPDEGRSGEGGRRKPGGRPMRIAEQRRRQLLDQRAALFLDMNAAVSELEGLGDRRRRKTRKRLNLTISGLRSSIEKVEAALAKINTKEGQ